MMLTSISRKMECKPLGNHRFVQLDVFTREPFAGNPLAVFPEAEGLTDDEMMKIAREMNLSETVFVLKPDSYQQTANSKQQAESDSPSAGASQQSPKGSRTRDVIPEESAPEEALRESDPPKTDDEAERGDAQAPVLRRLRIFTPAREIPFAGHPV